MFKIGDLVIRIKYKGDIIFEIKKIYRNRFGEGNVVLVAKDSRLVVTAPLDDLEKVNRDKLFRNLINQKRAIQQRIPSTTRELTLNKEAGFKKRMKVLHLDGEKTYIDICKNIYDRAGLNSFCVSVSPQEQSRVVKELLIRERPDILVLTGHDSLKRDHDPKKMESYWFSKDYLEAVQTARDYCRDIDDLVIYAGACQSNFEALIEAGANFASSPARINIYPSEPALIVALLSTEPVNKYLDYKAIDESLPNGLKGIGGVQTKGKLRIGGPKTEI